MKTGKTVLITGAGSGLGRELSLEFARRGYNLVLVSKTLQNLKETAGLVKEISATVTYFVVDVTKLTAVDKLKKALARRKIKIDTLVNNAGVGFFGTIAETSLERIRAMMEVNYFGSVYFAKAFLNELISGRGTIVFINTAAGKIVIPRFSAYAPTKAALDFFATALTRELSGKVKVVNVISGPIKTDFWSDPSFRRLKRRFLFKEPAAVAKEIVKGVLQGKTTVVVPSWLSLLLLANRISNSLVYWLFEKIYKI